MNAPATLAQDEPDLSQSFDPLLVDARSDEDLDQVAFGVVCLDRDGTILRYNLAEARFARLDRNTVLGKNFFRQIAPCTATPEFEGRFRAFSRPLQTEPLIRFSYLFDFKFGAQQVDVELVRSPVNRFYLLINRRRFFAERDDVAPEKKAPLQQELSPGEEALGIQRDQAQQRSFRVSAPFFGSLRATWERVSPNAWGMFCTEWGFRWGRTAVIDMETLSLERHEKSLRDLSMTAAMDLVADFLRESGWGFVSLDFTHMKQGAFLVTVDRSALAESFGRSGQDVPRCHLLSGFFRAVFCHLAQKLLTVREISCQCQTGAACTFLVVGQERKAALEQASKAAGSDLTAILRALAEAPRGLA